jgi:hypothetical protein
MLIEAERRVLTHTPEDTNYWYLRPLTGVIVPVIEHPTDSLSASSPDRTHSAPHTAVQEGSAASNPGRVKHRLIERRDDVIERPDTLIV